MRKNHLHQLFGILIATLCILAIPLQSQAATKGKTKTIQAAKERLVLMPLRVPEEDKNLTGAMETALVEGLQQKYEVFSGEQVAQKARQIFMKESRNTAHKECDETRCMQGIAEAFQAELIATANVTKQEGSYFIALSIQNIFDNKVVDSKSKTCENCKAVQVIDKLKELVGTPVPVAAEAAQPKVNQNDPDSLTWAEAQKGNSADDYQVYLDAYPKGKYVLFAKAKLKKLKESEQAAADQQEQQVWDTTQKENSEASFNRYIQTYPSGRFVGFAKSRLSKLKADMAYKEEAELWQKAESGSDRNAVENYLNKYPTGRYFVVAETKLTAIKEEEAKFTPPTMIRIPGKNFEMGKYEVTQKEWRAIMGNSPSQFTSCGDNCPVEQVSWDDIQFYLQKLNAKTSKQYRLPTEAEWEVGCRGGKVASVAPPNPSANMSNMSLSILAMAMGATVPPNPTIVDTEEYCGSNQINTVAWSAANSNETTHPVGQKQANGYGLYDMSGNVWEWMLDEDKGLHALRGGSWISILQSMRVSYRTRSWPASRDSSYGFRLARTLP